MNMDRRRNGPVRVPTRAKLIPQVVRWSPKTPPKKADSNNVEPVVTTTPIPSSADIVFHPMERLDEMQFHDTDAESLAWTTEGVASAAELSHRRDGCKCRTWWTHIWEPQIRMCAKCWPILEGGRFVAATSTGERWVGEWNEFGSRISFF